MKRNIALSIIIVLSLNIAYAQPCKEVVGYYPNWQWYKRSGLVNPKTIDYSKYTILNYSFFKPDPSGRIDTTDWWADENLLLGETDWSKGGYKANTSIIDLAHQKGVKVMVSIGGWTLSDNFPGIAASASKRQYFANECVRLIKKFNFDGIDIDWEYPGYANHSGGPADKINFTLLMQDIRTAIDNHGKSNGKKYLLSAAFSATAVHAKNIEWDKIKEILNMINLMSYDFFGPWDVISNHNSPLYAPAQGEATFNTDAAFHMLTDTYKVPASQINIGLAFYGKSYAGCKGLFQSHTGANTTLYAEDDGGPMYYNVMKNFSTFTKYWDDKAKVPYAVSTQENTVVCYDDEQSISIKADYIMKNNARGCIIWEITGDYLESSPGQISGTPLANKISEVFCAVSTGMHAPFYKQSAIEVYPNPASDFFTIKTEKEIYLIIMDISGKIALEKQIEGGTSTIDFRAQAKGIYAFVFKSKDGKVVEKRMMVK